MQLFMVMEELAQQHREVVESLSLEASETQSDKLLLRCGYNFNRALSRRLNWRPSKVSFVLIMTLI